MMTQHTFNAYSTAASFRNTIVNLNRTPEDMAREAALVDAYNRGMNAQSQALKRREKDLLKFKDDSLCNLPPHFRDQALQADSAPVPSEMNPPTHTPPIPGYDPQESYGRPDNN
jgi:hypothetical protein